MKSKVAIVILVTVCLALGVGLVTVQRKYALEKKERDDQIALQTKKKMMMVLAAVTARYQQ